jgi:ParB family chromosome partitioning protein
MSEAKEPSEAVTVGIDRIDTSRHYRQDVGDLEKFKGLKQSIKEVGLINPLLIQEEGDRTYLIAGFRRLSALKEIGAKIVSCRIITKIDNALMALKAERDENTWRLDPDPVSSVALAEAILAIEKPRAARRKAASQFKAGGKKEESDGGSNLDEPQNSNESAGSAVDKAAEAVGMSGATLRKAREVVEAAKAEPEHADLVAEMKQTGKVDRAFKKLRERKGKPVRSKKERVEPAPESEPAKLKKRLRCPHCKARFTIEV